MSGTTSSTVAGPLMAYSALRDRLDYPPNGPRLARHEWHEVVGTPAEAIYDSMREVGAAWMWANFFGNRFGTDEHGNYVQEQLLGTEGVPAICAARSQQTTTWPPACTATPSGGDAATDSARSTTPRPSE